MLSGRSDHAATMRCRSPTSIAVCLTTMAFSGVGGRGSAATDASVRLQTASSLVCGVYRRMHALRRPVTPGDDHDSYGDRQECWRSSHPTHVDRPTTWP